MRVLLSADLAALYGVAPKALVQGVKRNAERFPADFMFQLTADEYRVLKSQRALPYAFTEQGVAMLSSVLRSPRVVAVNVEIMRAFVRLRSAVASIAAGACPKDHRLPVTRRRRRENGGGRDAAPPRSGARLERLLHL